MNLPPLLDYRRLKRAFGNSLDGFHTVWKDETAFRQEVVLAAALIPLALWVDVGTLEKILLIGSMILVLIVELLNSAVEAAIDRISPELHPLSRKAKDAGSAAVLLSLLGTMGVWLTIIL